MKWIFALSLFFFSGLGFCSIKNKDLKDLYALYSFSRRQMDFSKGHYFLENRFNEHSLSIGRRIGDSFGLELGYSWMSSETQREFSRKPEFMVHHTPTYLFPIVYKTKFSLSGVFINALFFHELNKRVDVFYGGGIKFARGRFERRLVRLGDVPCYWSRVLYRNRTIPTFSVGLEYKINDTFSVRSFYGVELTSRLKFESDIESYPLSVWPRNSRVWGIGISFR